MSEQFDFLKRELEYRFETTMATRDAEDAKADLEALLEEALRINGWCVKCRQQPKEGDQDHARRMAGIFGHCMHCHSEYNDKVGDRGLSYAYHAAECPALSAVELGPNPVHGLFRKRPVTVEAIRWVGEDNCEEVFEFLGLEHPDNDETDHSEIRIPTLEGTITASVGDWIIKGVKGEFYPCKPDIFELTYEAL